MKFENVQLREELTKAFVDLGYEKPTTVQQDALPILLEGHDMIAQSQTGTGKTAAFSIPILERLDPSSKNVQAIVLCPTRELAVQVKDEILKLGKYLDKFNVACVYGGEPVPVQLRQLSKKPQIVVGTPGRTIDLLKRGKLVLSDANFLVLDEADEMLKMGFREDIEQVIDQTNSERQTLLFSATMPRAIKEIANKYLTNPKHITVTKDEQTNKNIKQVYFQVRERDKIEAVSRVIHTYQPKLALIFCNTKRKVDDVAQMLIDRNFNCDKIHGEIPQTSRLDVLKKFNNGVIDILVATDVAARGIDIEEVEAVINYDVPEKADHYVHRIGRTGRAGRTGYSFTFVSKREFPRILDIERYTKSKVRKRELPDAEKVVAVKRQRFIDSTLESIGSKSFESIHEEMAQDLIIAGYDPAQIIASLISKNFIISDEVSGGDINDRYQSNVRSDSRMNRSRGKSFSSEGDTRFFMNLGARDKMQIKDLLVAVEKQCNIPGREINQIKIMKEFTFFNTNPKNKNRILKDLRKVNDKKVSIEVARAKK